MFKELVDYMITLSDSEPRLIRFPTREFEFHIESNETLIFLALSELKELPYEIWNYEFWVHPYFCEGKGYCFIMFEYMYPESNAKNICWQKYYVLHTSLEEMKDIFDVVNEKVIEKYGKDIKTIQDEKFEKRKDEFE